MTSTVGSTCCRSTRGYSSISRSGPTTWLLWAFPTSASPVYRRSTSSFSASCELPADEAERASASLPRVSDLCDELAGFGLPETIQHDDFHDGQVYVRDGRYLLLDWGDACVSHPFFTLSVTLEGMLAWGLDDVEGSVDTTPFLNAYLTAFADYGDRSALEAAATIALRLGWVCRAVNARLGNPEGSNTDVHLRLFLDGRT